MWGSSAASKTTNRQQSALLSPQNEPARDDSERNVLMQALAVPTLGQLSSFQQERRRSDETLLVASDASLPEASKPQKEPIERSRYIEAYERHSRCSPSNSQASVWHLRL